MTCWGLWITGPAGIIVLLYNHLIQGKSPSGIYVMGERLVDVTRHVNAIDNLPKSLCGGILLLVSRACIAVERDGCLGVTHEG